MATPVVKSMCIERIRKSIHDIKRAQDATPTPKGLVMPKGLGKHTRGEATPVVMFTVIKLVTLVSERHKASRLMRRQAPVGW